MRLAFAVMGIVCFIYAVWHAAMTRSLTIRLETAGYELTYSMSWGLSMEERLSLRKFGGLWSSPTSEWTDIWKKPYNSGVVVYVSDDGQTYYFGIGYKLDVFQPKQGAYWTTCDSENVPRRTPFAERLSAGGYDAADDEIDANRRQLFEYINADDSSSAVPSLPPPSKYYAGLKYLESFG